VDRGAGHHRGVHLKCGAAIIANHPPHWLTGTTEGIRLQIRVQPRAARTEIVGEHGGALKIRVAAPPVDGAANDALVGFLAERLGVARSSVSLGSGALARSKVVLVAGIGPEAARARLGLLNFAAPGR
jgi:uncharacterized protein (TIGR00251 family)